MKRSKSNSQCSNIFRKATLSTAIALALGSYGAFTQAQNSSGSTTAEVEEEVLVRGIRGSLMQSQAIKQQNTSIVEAVTAEDIGKLPDSSIAESISRLPGLAAQRLDGRASVITIRGLGEEFSLTTFNGREQVSINDNRGVEYDIFPSELINAVVVHKTPDATLTTQAIAGTVDLQTIKPLAHGRQTVSVGLRGEQSSLDPATSDGFDTGWRGNLAYVDQFADDTIGVALAVTHMESPSNSERFRSWDTNGQYGMWDTNGDDLDDSLIWWGGDAYVATSELKRDSVLGVLEFEPNDSTHLTLDAMYIEFEDVRLLRGINIPGAGGGDWSGQDVTVGRVNDGWVESGTFTTAKPVIRNQYDSRNAELFSFGVNGEFELTDNFTLTADASHSSVERQIYSLEIYAGTARGFVAERQGLQDAGFDIDPLEGADNISFEMYSGLPGVRLTPGINYGSYDEVRLGGPASWGGGNVQNPDAQNDQDGFINYPEIEDELNALRLAGELKFDNGPVTSVDVGLHYSMREKSREDSGDFIVLKGYGPATGGIDNPVNGDFDHNYMETVPEQYRRGTADLSFFFDGQYTDMIAIDPRGVLNSGLYNFTSENLTATGRTLRTWTVNEDIATLYAMANLGTDIRGFDVTGNLGLQVVHTDQSSDGFAAVVGEDGIVQRPPVSGGDTYTNLLPSLNLNVKLDEAQTVRFAAARTMSRSRMDRMNASFGYSYDPTAAAITSGDGMGNPELRPYKADQLDLSYENYFSEEGYFAVALFYKKLNDWQLSIIDENFDTSLLNPPNLDRPLSEVDVRISSWENLEGGHIKGAELTVSLPGNLLSETLDGFGMILSGTFLDSEIDPGENFDPQQIPGLSDRIYNATFYYEKNGFEFRTSVRKRSEFLGEVAGVSFARVPVNIGGEELWDAQISYNFSESDIASLEGVTVSLQAQNLTDEPFYTYFGDDKRQVSYSESYGTNYLLGVSYTF